MDYELPTDFDLLVVGTGVIESMVAAAASRIGKRVLHLDSNDYYGGVWSSFNLDAVGKVIIKTKRENEQIEASIGGGEKLLHFGNDLFDVKDAEQTWHVPEKLDISCDSKKSEGSGSNENEVIEKENTEPNEKISQENSKTDDLIRDEAGNVLWSQETLLKESRRFNIDLAPKLQFARGNFVELLIFSNIARYSEFRSVSRVLTYIDGSLKVAPCSRSDVFSNANVTGIEKRHLMQLLTACLDGDDSKFEPYAGITFKSFLKERNLTDNVIHYIMFPIAMCTEDTLCLEGVEKTKRFVMSLGRFGKTPFLYSMYGSGEITQAFCRLSAVFGGVYALNQTLNGLVIDKDNRFKSIFCGKQRIFAENLVASVEHAPKCFVEKIGKSYISRAVFVTDKSMLESEKEHLSLLVFPEKDGKSVTTLIEMGSLTGTCPKNVHLVHMFTKQRTNPKEDFSYCVGELFTSGKDNTDSKKPKVLWSFYYSVPDETGSDLSAGLPENVYLCPGPDADLDYDKSIEKAMQIFSTMYPDLEFLPRAPDPEEIIIEGEEDNNQSSNQDDDNNKASGDAVLEEQAN